MLPMRGRNRSAPALSSPVRAYNVTTPLEPSERPRPALELRLKQRVPYEGGMALLFNRLALDRVA